MNRFAVYLATGGAFVTMLDAVVGGLLASGLGLRVFWIVMAVFALGGVVYGICVATHQGVGVRPRKAAARRTFAIGGTVAVPANLAAGGGSGASVKLDLPSGRYTVPSLVAAMQAVSTYMGQTGLSLNQTRMSIAFDALDVKAKPLPPVTRRSGYAIGVREWAIDDDNRLCSVNSNFGTWEPGINTARCRALTARSGHHAPAAYCTCGFYVRKLSDVVLQTSSLHVLGAVRCWGRIIEHQEGFRAEHAEVVALLRPDCTPVLSTSRLRSVWIQVGCWLTKIDTTAKTYGVPCLPEHDDHGRTRFLDYIGEFGEIWRLKRDE